MGNLIFIVDWWNKEQNLTVADTAPDSIRHLVHHHWSLFPAVHPFWHLLLGVLYLLLGVVSISGQTIVLYLFCRNKFLRTPANLLIVNLAFSDLMMMITQFPVFIMNCWYGGAWQLGSLLCELTGFAGGLFGYGSIVTHAAISIDRYNVIVRGFAAPPFTHVKATFVIAFIWVWSLSWSVMPFFSWGKFVPEGILSSCSFDYLTRDFQTVSYIIGCWSCEFFTPFLVIIFCYVFIVKAVWDHESQLRAQAKKMNVASLRTNTSDKSKSSEMKIAKVALINILLYVFSWAPYATVAMIGIAGNQMLITPLRSSLPALAGKAASVYNPIVYAISHPKFRQALNSEMSLCCIKKASTDTDTDANTTIDLVTIKSKT